MKKQHDNKLSNAFLELLVFYLLMSLMTVLNDSIHCELKKTDVKTRVDRVL